MRCRTYDDARHRAQSNANASGQPWIVFSDTSGAWNAERVREDAPRQADGVLIVPTGDGASLEPKAVQS